MRIVIGLLAALLLSGLSAPAHAQPRGSYLRSCWHVRVHYGDLSAVCRRVDGRGQRTVLRDVRRCVGDIANINGTLRCRRVAGPPVPPPPDWNEHGWRRHHWRRCERLRERREHLRARLDRTPYWDRDRRDRLRDRLQETREEYRRGRCWRYDR